MCPSMLRSSHSLCSASGGAQNEGGVCQFFPIRAKNIDYYSSVPWAIEKWRIGLIMPTNICTYRKNLVKIGPVRTEIIVLKGTVKIRWKKVTSATHISPSVCHSRQAIINTILTGEAYLYVTRIQRLLRGCCVHPFQHIAYAVKIQNVPACRACYHACTTRHVHIHSLWMPIWAAMNRLYATCENCLFCRPAIMWQWPLQGILQRPFVL